MRGWQGAGTRLQLPLLGARPVALRRRSLLQTAQLRSQASVLVRQACLLCGSSGGGRRQSRVQGGHRPDGPALRGVSETSASASCRLQTKRRRVRWLRGGRRRRRELAAEEAALRGAYGSGPLRTQPLRHQVQRGEVNLRVVNFIVVVSHHHQRTPSHSAPRCLAVCCLEGAGIRPGARASAELSTGDRAPHNAFDSRRGRTRARARASGSRAISLTVVLRWSARFGFERASKQRDSRGTRWLGGVGGCTRFQDSNITFQ